jgi:hypothetical protein
VGDERDRTLFAPHVRFDGWTQTANEPRMDGDNTVTHGSPRRRHGGARHLAQAGAAAARTRALRHFVAADGACGRDHTGELR